MGMKLYEYPREFDRLVDQARNEEEMTDDWVEEVRQLGGDFKEKVLNCIKLIRELEGSSTAMEREVTRLKSRSLTCRNKIQWLKQYVHYSMEAMEMDVIEDEIFNVRVAKSPPRVNIVDQTVIPVEFLAHGEVKVLKTAIKDALKAGREVQGCELETGTCLRIR